MLVEVDLVPNGDGKTTLEVTNWRREDANATWDAIVSRFGADRIRDITSSGERSTRPQAELLLPRGGVVR